jgi:hypothetical protein
VGQVVPPFGTFRAENRHHKRRRISRKVTAVAVAVGLALTGTAAAAVVTHLTSAPVTETDLARCYSVDSLAGGENFAGLSVAASGPIGSHAQVTNALEACTPSWADGFLILGSTEVGGSRLPSGVLTPDHPVPPLVVCVLPSGIAAVFPGNPTTCQTLGLPAALGYQPAHVHENAH